ncbi:Zn-ribbon-containing protein [Shewanella xiamenensis]|uniref:Zn-ribbon-containing protein n=1 Tax=Shewanella xiamenensis TaxID=332186 RepID=A0ABT6U772_9GAMM|nr:Zn-ribbon-containing protein [Shewanella xiamenensis]MDI5830316.1 Zn-ribbon-containing protein [Shewanella xiamenensis]MDI5836037.1 Zn-ribbon-containing protein [Shewanella xiamenensis]MDI5840010.1 Zn-ribbon-containing protein [Shewanella xiamenensis]MDI5843824.1 Zn-ribbon-containing protein [Shewanella xiamenensis]MDI5848381.1 Zn-ribbon-containing protein [Shewanella xiamenensis]
MFVTELRFECFADTTISAAERAINQLLEAYRANGQILGREFAVAFNEGEFRVRLLTPEKNSLAHRYHSPWVKKALAELTEAKLLAPREKFIGQDINSEVSNTEPPSWQLLYTSYVHMCSPLRSGDNLLPIPLYQIPATFNGDHKRVIRWQTEWQACDELQMAAATKAEFAALEELSSPNSDLFRRGWDLRGRIEYLTKIPTYYYLYRVGGQDLQSELARPCPRCGSHTWMLDEPLLDMFHFRCEPCRIVSNLSWDHQ